MHAKRHNVNIQQKLTKTLHVAVTRPFYCATQICIARTCYGDVTGWLGGWLAVRHTPVLYQNG